MTRMDFCISSMVLYRQFAVAFLNPHHCPSIELSSGVYGGRSLSTTPPFHPASASLASAAPWYDASSTNSSTLGSLADVYRSAVS